MSDLSFIQDIGVDQRSVYVVLTKADLRPDDDIEDIMDEVQEVLFSEGISVVGISAYSSTLRNEVAYRDVPLLSISPVSTSPATRGNTLKVDFWRCSPCMTMLSKRTSMGFAHKTAVNGLRLDCPRRSAARMSTDGC